MSEDTISRKAAIEALKETFNPSITNFVKAKMAIDNLPSAQPEKRTENTRKTHACDCIERQAAIDAIVAQTIGYTVEEIKRECEENIFNENGYLGGLKKDAEMPHEPHIPFETLQNACKYRRTYHEIEGYFKKRDVCYNKKNAAECNSECPLLKSYEEVDA